jgi:acetyl esterase/lipase
MKTLLSALLIAIVTCSAFGQEKDIPLYPGGIPNSKTAPAGYVEKTNSTSWIYKVTQPRLIPYFPQNGTANGAAIVICPGGGYGGLAAGYEGKDVAQEFARIGVAAFVLIYRLPSDDIMTDRSIGPLQDAQMAILTVRKHAAEWHIDPSKIGIMGFSAGGHLASTEGTHFDRPVIDNKDSISLRPDFMMLLYPVITFGKYTHTGSKENLIGKTPDVAQVDLYSNEKQVTANTPPTFLVQAEDDKVVPVQNSLLFYEALLMNNVKAELHLFQEGGHGFGMNNKKNKGKWFEWGAAWLEENGFLSQK